MTALEAVRILQRCYAAPGRFTDSDHVMILSCQNHDETELGTVLRVAGITAVELMPWDFATVEARCAVREKELLDEKR